MIPAVQEMLMHKPCLSRNRRGDLFSLPAKLPELPAEVRQKMVRLLARMLNEHWLRRCAVMTPAFSPDGKWVNLGAAAAIVGRLAPGLGPARMNVSDFDRMGGGSSQLFLASAVRRELGTRPVLSRTTCHARFHWLSIFRRICCCNGGPEEEVFYWPLRRLSEDVAK